MYNAKHARECFITFPKTEKGAEFCIIYNIQGVWKVIRILSWVFDTYFIQSRNIYDLNNLFCQIMWIRMNIYQQKEVLFRQKKSALGIF